jgi:hypothetical protein
MFQLNIICNELTYQADEFRTVPNGGSSNSCHRYFSCDAGQSSYHIYASNGSEYDCLEYDCWRNDCWKHIRCSHGYWVILLCLHLDNQFGQGLTHDEDEEITLNDEKEILTEEEEELPKRAVTEKRTPPKTKADALHRLVRVHPSIY